MNDVPIPRDPRRGPSFARLLDWVEGRLDEAASREVAAAVEAGDEATRESVAWIRAFHAAAAEMPLETPPPDVSARLRDVFDRLQRPASDGPWSDATPDHGDDDSGLPQAAGFRSVDQGAETAHLVFHSEIGDLLLRVGRSAARGEVDLEGRVLVAASEPAREAVEVAVMAAGVLHGAARCSTDDGGFALRGIPQDADEVWLTWGDLRVRAVVDFSTLW